VIHEQTVGGGILPLRERPPRETSEEKALEQALDDVTGVVRSRKGI